MVFRKKMYRKKRAAPKRKGGIVRRAVRKAKKQVFARRVRQVVNRMSETKVATWRSDNNPVNNYPLGLPIVSTASANHDLYIKELVPGDGTTTHSTLVIGQGDGQSNRAGNEITTVSCKLSGVLRFNTTFNTTTGYKMCPVYVTLWIVSLAKHLNDTLQNIETTIQNSFFQDGNSSMGFDGTMNDMVKQVNKSTITVHKRRVFKLGVSEVPSSTAGSGAAAAADQANQRWLNNDFDLSRMFQMDITKVIPKKYRFNDAIDLQLNNRRRWMFFSCARCDGTAPVTDGASTTGPIVAYASLNLDYRFKDM